MTTQYPKVYFDSLLPKISLAREGGATELAATLVWLAPAVGGYVMVRR